MTTIDRPRRLAFWAGIGGILLGLWLITHLFETQPGLGAVRIYLTGLIPPFGLWAIVLGLARLWRR